MYASGITRGAIGHSEVAFTVRHVAVSKVRGRFDKFEGTFVTAEDPLASSVNATIDASSINTNQEQPRRRGPGTTIWPPGLDASRPSPVRYCSKGSSPDGSSSGISTPDSALLLNSNKGY
jgi:hypothetical protein